jgi:RNase H-fold protein (predicted Holliday junction resolvase)
MTFKVLSIDPGREKCGVAIVESTAGQSLSSDASGNSPFVVLRQEIVPRQQMMARLGELIECFLPDAFLLGNATTSKALATGLVGQWPQIALHIVDEAGSTLAARDLFWKAHPPRGWRRCVPLSLQYPPVPLDDFAALVLAQRFFQNPANSSKPSA